MIKHEEDLKKLEEISIQISNLINNNDYEKILELDIHRKKIINKISNSSYSFSKNKISKIINLNALVWLGLDSSNLLRQTTSELRNVVI